MQIVYMCHMHSCVFVCRHRKIHKTERYEHMWKQEGNRKSGLIEIFFYAFVYCYNNFVIKSKSVENA